MLTHLTDEQSTEVSSDKRFQLDHVQSTKRKRNKHRHQDSGEGRMYHKHRDHFVSQAIL